jgi:cyclopropane fatty-acyl-phospholipid synthase-like methyltransferase
MHDEEPNRQAISQTMKSHYEAVWQEGDVWSFETSEYEQRRYDFHLAMLDGRRYGSTLEIGCGSGGLTRRLAAISDRVLALDISSNAIERARTQLAALPQRDAIELRAADIMTFDAGAHGPWDLIVFSETIYCVGWLYPMFDVALMASNLRASMRPGGRLLLSNTYGERRDWLLRPWLIDTYRDLFRNVGLTLEREDVFTGNKDTVEMRVLMSLFTACDA